MEQKPTISLSFRGSMRYVDIMETNEGTAIVAIGGNAIYTGDAPATIEVQMEAAEKLATQIVAMTKRGWRVILTHGNGPQVGFIMRRSDVASQIDPDLPVLDLTVSGAQSQGGLGYILSNAFQRALADEGIDQDVVAVVSHAVVDADDPAFGTPTKPIGSFYEKEEAEILAEENNWTIIEDSGRGWRRVVASPKPKRILESRAIKKLVDSGFLVIGAGGGGIPIVEDEDGGFTGVEAVIDKDFASSLLATDVGVDLLAVTTGVDQVAINFGTPEQENLHKVTASQMRKHLEEGQFPPGSMGPKIEAALEYLDAGGKEVLITSPDSLQQALEGTTGTWITAD